MLARLRESMAIAARPPFEQVLCEKKITLTERLDHILFTVWDPIGVHFLEDFDCEDEYHGYLPEIVDLVTEGASVGEIADALFAFETLILGEDLRCRRRCYIAATEIVGCDPSNGNLHMASQPDLCDTCLVRHALPPKAHCIDSPGYGVKPTVYFID